MQQPQQQMHGTHHQQIQYQQMQQQADIIERIDPGTKSEGEDDSQHGSVMANINTGAKPKATLGRTPNHLTLSTTSTLSVGSTGSQARLIQSSHPPSNYQPMLMKDLGKPNSIQLQELSYPQAEHKTRCTSPIPCTNVNKRTGDGVTGEEYNLDSDIHAASMAAAFNLSIGCSGSLFTSALGSSSSSSSSGGGCNKVDYQSDAEGFVVSDTSTLHRIKRSSPRQSPKQDIEVIEIFTSDLEHNSLSANKRVSIVPHAKESSKINKIRDYHSDRESDTDMETDTENRLGDRDRNKDNNNDENDNLSADMASENHVRFMDKHLIELEHGGLTHEIGCDIVAYMANLKEQAQESHDTQSDNQDQQQNDSSLSPEPQTIVENTQQVLVVADIESPPRPATESDTTTTGASERSEDESYGPVSILAQNIVKIDKKVDKVFKSKTSDKSGHKSTSSHSNGNTSTSSTGSSSSKSKNLSTGPVKIKHISPDRSSKSQGSSPVRIIKIKSPRGSITEQNKRLGVSRSRDSSQDRLSSGTRTPSPRRSSEGGGGILKRAVSPSGSILKPTGSPSKSKSPDRSCLKNLNSGHDCSLESVSPHLSPRDSIERLSPVERGGNNLCLRHSPRSSFDSRTSEPRGLDIPHASIKSPNSSFESRSPERVEYTRERERERGRSINRKRSLSTQPSFESSNRQPPEAFYHYYPVYDKQTCSDHYVSAGLRRDDSGSSYGTRQRLSKSLERSISRESSGSSYQHYVYSPERACYVQQSTQGLEGNMPLRSQSAENAFSRLAYEYNTTVPAPLPPEVFDMNSSWPYQPNMPMYQHEPQCPHEQPTVYYYSSSAPEHTTCMDCLYKKRPS